jgi:tyramine---L-glutamate ligase
LLLTRCRWAHEEGSRLLGSSPDAVALTGDKLALSRQLQAQRIPTPDTWPLAAGAGLMAVGFPAVLKPRHGAGSGATFLAHDVDELLSLLEEAHRECDDELLLQPYVPGQAASVAFLVGPTQRVRLLPASQSLSQDGRFRYLGGTIPLPPALGDRACRLAAQAVEAVRGLRGYVGVDLVLGAAEDGSQDSVIEINRRLTTSYVGLRALAIDNLAEQMLAVVQGTEVTSLRWRRGRVEFRADGHVTSFA